LQGELNSGARHVFAVDPVQWKRDQALKFGASYAYSDIESATAAIADSTQAEMEKKVIVTVGEADDHDVDKWMGITAKGGTCVVTAMSKSILDTDVTLNLSMLTLMQKNLQGTIFGGGNPQFYIPQVLSMYKVGELNLDDMVTREYTLDQINEGYQDTLSGRTIRGVIRFTDADRKLGAPATVELLGFRTQTVVRAPVVDLPQPVFDVDELRRNEIRGSRGQHHQDAQSRESGQNRGVERGPLSGLGVPAGVEEKRGEMPGAVDQDIEPPHADAIVEAVIRAGVGEGLP
jgi:hypothetical protein